jgi:glycosyltransferase involved in cell wall biosynthesis
LEGTELKLVFVNRYFFPDISATSQALMDLATDQARRGREVHVVTSRQLYEDPAADLPAEGEHEGVRIHRVRTSTFGRHNLAGRALDYATFYLSAARCLWTLARAGDVIVANTDPPLVSVVAGWVARLRGARLVNWLHDVFPEIAQRLDVAVLRGPLGAFARRLRDTSLRTAAVNVVLGERMKAVVKERVGPRSRVEVVENWADGALIRPLPAAGNALRRQWGLEGRFVVGYSGNLGRAHEFDTILGAAEMLRGEPEFAFLFIGGGRQRAWVEDEAARMGLANVVFQPYQPRDLLAASLSSADVHLVTLQAGLEGLIVPSKFYGVAAAGRPTIFIGDPDGEIARHLSREACGTAVRTGDTRGLASAIRALRADPAEAAAMGSRARSAFERTWDRPHAMERWNAVLPL